MKRIGSSLAYLRKIFARCAASRRRRMFDRTSIDLRPARRPPSPLSRTGPLAKNFRAGLIGCALFSLTRCVEPLLLKAALFDSFVFDGGEGRLILR